LRLHTGYNIPAATSKKLHMQRVGPFRVLERIGRLAYKLDIPSNWQFHPVFSVAHLEPAPADDDPFGRPRPEEPESMYVDGDDD
jgi:hypothetical protein